MLNFIIRLRLKGSAFPISCTHKEKQIFFNIDKHTHASINSWKTTNTKSVFVCKDVKGLHCMETGLQEISLFPGRVKMWDSDRGELKSHLFRTGGVLYYRKAGRNAVKGSNNRSWGMFGPRRRGSEDIYWGKSWQRNIGFVPPDVDLLLDTYWVFPASLRLKTTTRASCKVFKNCGLKQLRPT